MNNREIATAAWILAFLIFALTKEGVRSSILDFIRTAKNRHILTILSLMLVYVICQCFVLNLVGLWSYSQLKNTTVWWLTYALSLLFSFNKSVEDEHFFRVELRKTIGLAVLVEFIVGFHPFGLITELVLVPIAAMMAGVSVIAKRKAEHAAALRFSEYVLAGIGFAMIANATFFIVGHFWQINKLDALVDLASPIFLSITYLPFILFLLLYVKYENTFLVIDRFVPNHLRAFTKQKILLRFNLRISLLDWWRTRLPLWRLETKDSVESSISTIYKLHERERNPDLISSRRGWSPYFARRFLSEHGIEVGHYQDSSESYWFASSTPLDINSEIFPDNICYYISGTETAATSLKIVLHIRSQSSSASSKKKFIELSRFLIEKALCRAADPEVLDAVAGEYNVSTKQGHIGINVSNETASNVRMWNQWISLKISVDNDG